MRFQGYYMTAPLSTVRRVQPNPSIERTATSTLRVLASAAHVER